MGQRTLTLGIWRLLDGACSRLRPLFWLSARGYGADSSRASTRVSGCCCGPPLQTPQLAWCVTDQVMRIAPARSSVWPHS
eukprot:2327740-Alexandrium_andersonii.AAC.1